ncbi:uncharacterized protein V6R79_011758 [Siganus canaliculatus]
MARRNFLALFLLTSCLVSGQSPRYVLKGQKVTLKKDITGRPDNILWKHNGNKVVEFNGREEYVYDLYKSRVTLDWSSAELNITDLRLEDSGKYELEVSVNKKLEKSHHDMEVLDRVAKPTISCNISNSDNAGTLVCSAEPRQPVHLMTFEWHSQGSVHPGPHLQISLGGKLDDQVYNCTVRNPLTTETAAFTAKDCYTTKSSSAALIVTVIVMSLLLLLLIVGVVILYYCKKQKGCFEKRQTDSTDLTDLEKQKQCFTKGEAVKTDETMPLIDGQPSGKSVGGTPRSSQMPDLNDGGGSSISFTASDQNRADHQNTQSFPSSETPDATQKEDDTNIKITIVEDHFSEAPEKEEGHASNELPAESHDVNQDASSEEKPSTPPASSASDKNKDQPSGFLNWLFPSRTKEADHQNAEASPSSVTLADAGETKEESPTVEDRLSEDPDQEEGHASTSVQNRTDHQNTEASPSSVTLADAAQNKDDVNNKSPTVEDRLSEDPDQEEGHASSQNEDEIKKKITTVKDHFSEAPEKEEGHAPNKSESPAESDDDADVNQDASSEQNYSTASASPASDKNKDQPSGFLNWLFPSRTKEADHQNAEASPSSVTLADAGETKEESPTVEDRLSEDPDQEEGHASTSVQNRTDHQNAEASPSSVTLADAAQNKDDVNNKSPTVEDRLSEDPDQEEGHASSQNEDEIKKKITTVKDHFSEAPEKEEGHAPNKSESPAESDDDADVNQDASSEQNYSTASASPASDKNKDQPSGFLNWLFPSRTKEADHQNAEASPSSVTLADAGETKEESPTVEDRLSEDPDQEEGHASTSVQNRTDHQNTEASPSSVTLADADQNKDDVNNKSPTVEDRLSEDPDQEEGHASSQNEDEIKKKITVAGKLEGHASKESVSSAESANEDTSSEQNSSTAPASPAPDKTMDQHSELISWLLSFRYLFDESCLSQDSDELEGHTSKESVSSAESANEDTSSEKNSTTAPVSSGFVKAQVKKIDSKYQHRW